MKIEVEPGLMLKILDQSDSKYIFETIDSQREYLGRWLPFVEFTKEIADTQKFIDSVVNAPKDGFEYVFSIRKNNEFAGIIGFKGTDKANQKTEIGYWLSEEFQRQGIVTKSVQKLCDFAFNNLGMNRIQIRCAVGNIPSKNIPKKLGFNFEGIEREGELLSNNVFADLEVYSKLKSD